MTFLKPTEPFDLKGPQFPRFKRIWSWIRKEDGTWNPDITVPVFLSAITFAACSYLATPSG